MSFQRILVVVAPNHVRAKAFINERGLSERNPAKQETAVVRVTTLDEVNRLAGIYTEPENLEIVALPGSSPEIEHEVRMRLAASIKPQIWRTEA